MKIKEIFSDLINACFGIAAAVLTLCCFGTAFSLEFSPLVITAVCAVTGAVLWLILRLVPRRIGVLVAVAVTVITSFLLAVFAFGEIFAQLNYTVNAFLSVYHRVYAVFPESLFFAGEAADNATLLLSAAGIELTALSVLTLCRARRFYPTLLAALTVLLPCFITVDTPPEPLVFVMLVAVLLALFASSFARRRQGEGSGFALALSFCVLAAIALILNSIFPFENYIRYTWQDDLLAQAESLSGVHTTFGNAQNPLDGLKSSDADEVDLSREGRRVLTHIRTLRVLAESDRRVYLRGTCYGEYEDNKWAVPDETLFDGIEGTPMLFTGSFQAAPETLSIITEKRGSVAYLPYYAVSLPEGMTPVYDVYLKNNNGVKSYDFEVLGEDGTTAEPDSAYTDFVYSNYLSMPNKTRLGLSSFCEGNVTLRELLFSDNTDVEDIAAAVQEVVSSHGHYALECERVPEDEDFAVHFIMYGDRGYCVHYATAATLLLRVMGVPARYVSGYCVDAKAGKWTDVTTDNAHAWAEYYDPDLGWRVLETTPAASDEPQESTASATRPSAEKPSQPAQQATSKPVETHPTPKKTSAALPWQVIISVGAVLLFIGIMILKKKITDVLRRKRFTNGDRDTRARYYYRYLLRLQKRLGKPIPQEIEDVATKARFSQSQVTEDELKALAGFTAQWRSRLYKSANVLKKLWYRYGAGV